MSSDDDNGPPQKRSRIDATPKGSCFQTPEYDEMETEDQQPSQSGQTMLDGKSWVFYNITSLERNFCFHKNIFYEKSCRAIAEK